MEKAKKKRRSTELNDHTQRGAINKAENAKASSSPIQVCWRMAASPPFMPSAHGRIQPGSHPQPMDANPSTASPNRTAVRPPVCVHGLGRGRSTDWPTNRSDSAPRLLSAPSQLPPLPPHLQFAMITIFKRFLFFGSITIIYSPHLEKYPTPL